VVELMDSCRIQGDQSAGQAQKVGVLLMRVTEDVTLISGMSIQIAAAIEEQNAVASEVSKNVCKIRDIDDNSNLNTEQISLVSDEVSNQSSALLSAVDKFVI
jgi:methyl-accepting chemotaxis protein